MSPFSSAAVTIRKRVFKYSEALHKDHAPGATGGGRPSGPAHEVGRPTVFFQRGDVSLVLPIPAWAASSENVLALLGADTWGVAGYFHGFAAGGRRQSFEDGRVDVSAQKPHAAVAHHKAGHRRKMGAPE